MGRRRIVVGIITVAALAAGVAAWRLIDNRGSRIGRHAIYVTDVATGGSRVWRAVADRDMWAPAVSRDGASIAWHETTAEGANADLLVAAADGTQLRRIVGGSHAAWSPDGVQLAFESQIDQPGNFDIYVIGRNGGATRRLTRDSALEWAPSWSADGRLIGFTSRRTGTDQLYVVDAASGSNERRVTSGPGDAVRLAWSPDGAHVAFGSSQSGNAEIYVADPDGSHAVAITSDPADDWDPVWSPDGRRIAFLSYRDRGVASLYVMDADGANQLRLSTNAIEDSGGFGWLADGRSIIHAAAPRD